MESPSSRSYDLRRLPVVVLSKRKRSEESTNNVVTDKNYFGTLVEQQPGSVPLCQVFGQSTLMPKSVVEKHGCRELVDAHGKRSCETLDDRSLLAFLEEVEGGEALANNSNSQQHCASTDQMDVRQTKAGRERARRERLNDRFKDLSEVLQLGNTAKSDKAMLITDAIRIVTQLRAEVRQLQRLNVVLEERVKDLTRATEQSLQAMPVNVASGLSSRAELVMGYPILRPQDGLW